MTALATVHATAYGYQQDCGGRKAFLERYPIIKDQNRLPKFSEMKVIEYSFRYQLSQGVTIKTEIRYFILSTKYFFRILSML